MAGRGEAIARKDSHCEIDPGVVDKYGIPVLRFNTSYTDYEINQAKHMKETFAEIMHDMGAVITWGGDDGQQNNYGLQRPAKSYMKPEQFEWEMIAQKAPLNKWSQAHDCKNLFCVDGGQFVSQADKNITWTILALSMRTSEYIVDQMKKHNI